VVPLYLLGASYFEQGLAGRDLRWIIVFYFVSKPTRLGGMWLGIGCVMMKERIVVAMSGDVVASVASLARTIRVSSLKMTDAGRITTQLGTPRGRYDEYNSKFSLSKKPRFYRLGKSQYSRR
jgi:hypothetical protein